MVLDGSGSPTFRTTVSLIWATAFSFDGFMICLPRIHFALLASPCSFYCTCAPLGRCLRDARELQKHLYKSSPRTRQGLRFMGTRKSVLEPLLRALRLYYTSSSHWNSRRSPPRATFVLLKSMFEPIRAPAPPDVLGVLFLHCKSRLLSHKLRTSSKVDFRATRAPDVVQKHQKQRQRTPTSKTDDSFALNEPRRSKWTVSQRRERDSTPCTKSKACSSFISKNPHVLWNKYDFRPLEE